MVAFLAVSALLARFLQTDNVERDDALGLVEAEAKGDPAGIIQGLDGCSKNPTCIATARRNAANPRLRRTGAVKILSLNAATANSPTGATGPTRLAWTVIGELPVVQCIQVRRTGNFFTGVRIDLLSLSLPIANEGNCPGEKVSRPEPEET